MPIYRYVYSTRLPCHIMIHSYKEQAAEQQGPKCCLVAVFQTSITASSGCVVVVHGVYPQKLLVLPTGVYKTQSAGHIVHISVMLLTSCADLEHKIRKRWIWT